MDNFNAGNSDMFLTSALQTPHWYHSMFLCTIHFVQFQIKSVYKILLHFLEVCSKSNFIASDLIDVFQLKKE